MAPYTAKVLIILAIVTILVGTGIAILVWTERHKNNKPSPSPNKPINVTVWNLTDSPIHVNGAGLVPATGNVSIPLKSGDTLSYTGIGKETITYTYNGTDTVMALTPTLALTQSQLTGDCFVANETSVSATFQISDGGTNTWSINVLSGKRFPFVFPLGYNLLYPGEGNSSQNIPGNIVNLVYYSNTDYTGLSNQFDINVIPITNNYPSQLYMYLGGYNPQTGNTWLELPDGLSVPVYIPVGRNYISVIDYNGQNVVLTTDIDSNPLTHVGTFFPMNILNKDYVIGLDGTTTFNPV